MSNYQCKCKHTELFHHNEFNTKTWCNYMDRVLVCQCNKFRKLGQSRFEWIFSIFRRLA